MERGCTGSMWQNSRIENFAEAGNGFFFCQPTLLLGAYDKSVHALCITVRYGQRTIPVSKDLFLKIMDGVCQFMELIIQTVFRN